jgi:hypothetical protein
MLRRHEAGTTIGDAVTPVTLIRPTDKTAAIESAGKRPGRAEIG